MALKRKISIKAIILGFLADIAGSMFLGTILGVIWGVSGIISKTPSKGVHKLPLLQNPTFLVGSLIIGFLFTCLGGYVAGRISKESQVLHGAGVGVLGVIAGVICCFSVPLWFNIISLLGMIPLAMFGGYLAKRGLKN